MTKNLTSFKKINLNISKEGTVHERDTDTVTNKTHLSLQTWEARCGDKRWLRWFSPKGANEAKVLEYKNEDELREKVFASLRHTGSPFANDSDFKVEPQEESIPVDDELLSEEDIVNLLTSKEVVMKLSRTTEVTLGKDSYD